MSPRLPAEWGTRVSLDLFFGGAGAGLLGSYLLIAARDGYDGLSVTVIVAGVALVLLGLLLLASELGRPAKGLRSMANRGSSWMARGALFNLALLAAALLLIFVHLAGLQLLVPVAAMLTVLCSGLVAAYPGFLLFAAKDIRLWRSRLLPWLMFFYSLMSGLSLLTLADNALHLGMEAILRPGGADRHAAGDDTVCGFLGEKFRRDGEWRLGRIGADFGAATLSAICRRRSCFGSSPATCLLRLCVIRQCGGAAHVARVNLVSGGRLLPEVFHSQGCTARAADSSGEA